MRNFDERMTEIKGRSRMRIARHRKQVLSLCVPLVMCLCIGGTLFWWQPDTQTYAQETTAPTVVTTSAKGSITIICGEERVEHTDPDVVMDISEMINGLELVHTDESTAVIHTDRNTLLISPVKEYTLFIEDGQGVTTEYTLSGNILKNSSTQLEYALTVYEKDQILHLLELQPD